MIRLILGSVVALLLLRLALSSVDVVRDDIVGFSPSSTTQPVPPSTFDPSAVRAEVESQPVIGQR